MGLPTIDLAALLCECGCDHFVYIEDVPLEHEIWRIDGNEITIGLDSVQDESVGAWEDRLKCKGCGKHYALPRTVTVYEPPMNVPVEHNYEPKHRGFR